MSTHKICFGWKLRKLIFSYALLSKGLHDDDLKKHKQKTLANFKSMTIREFKQNRQNKDLNDKW